MSKLQSNLLFIGIALAFLIWGALSSIIGPLLPEMMEAFTLSSTQAGFVFVPWSTGFSLGALVSKRLLDKYKFERLLPLFAGVGAICCILLFFCNSFLQFLAVFSLLGATGGATFTIAHAFVGQTFTTHRVAAISGLDFLFSFGGLSAPLLLVLLFSFALSWQFPFLVFAVACSICLIIYVVILLLSRSGLPIDGNDEPLERHRKPEKVVELPLRYLVFPAFFMGAFEIGQGIWFVSYSIDSGTSEKD